MIRISEFIDKCIALDINQELIYDNLSFDMIYGLKYQYPLNYKSHWYKFEIHARLKDHIKNIPKDSLVRVWMVSRFGDVGITSNINNPRGYDARISPNDLYEWRIKKILK